MAKVVVCGAGFLGKLGSLLLNLHSHTSTGSNIARHIAASSVTPRKVQISSRNPSKVYENLRNNSEIDKSSLLAPVAVDITRKETLSTAFENASVVVSLVGIMHGAPSDFERIQHKGAENVAIAARNAGAKLIHMSAIGADKNSSIPYAKTKGLGEEAVLHHNPEATIIRPSLVFGPGDGFFAVRSSSNNLRINVEFSGIEVCYSFFLPAISPRFCGGPNEVPASLCWGYCSPC